MSERSMSFSSEHLFVVLLCISLSEYDIHLHAGRQDLACKGLATIDLSKEAETPEETIHLETKEVFHMRLIYIRDQAAD